MKQMKALKDIDLANKRVFLRADLNVPLEDKKIMQDHKLHAILPTIDYILKAGGKVILATHIGRPDAQSEQNFFDENLSTELLVPWFEEHGYEIEYEVDLLQAAEKSSQDFSQILLLENLRFFNGEKVPNDTFAELLAQCADIYVNDAFGLFHRHDTSVTLLANKFDVAHRAHGLLFEREMEELSKLKQNPQQPFVMVLGGNKTETKVALLEKFVEQKTASTILLNGVLGTQIEPSLIKQAQDAGVRVLVPTDVMVASRELTTKPTPCPVDAIPDNMTIVDIGPQTREVYEQEIAKAQTIFANGTMGIYEDEPYRAGSKVVLKAIAGSPAYSIIGGGDAVAATLLFGLQNDMNFLSTGGGASLAFLVG